jgi:hypothetical protein
MEKHQTIIFSFIYFISFHWSNLSPSLGFGSHSVISSHWRLFHSRSPGCAHPECAQQLVAQLHNPLLHFSLSHSPTHSLTLHSLTHLFTHSLTHSLHLFILIYYHLLHLFITHSFIHSFHLFYCLPLCVSTYVIHSFIHSFHFIHSISFINIIFSLPKPRGLSLPMVVVVLATHGLMRQAKPTISTDHVGLFSHFVKTFLPCFPLFSILQPFCPLRGLTMTLLGRNRGGWI